MPKKSNSTRKNTKHHKKSLKKHEKKHHNKRKVAGVNEQDRIQNENRVRELNQQISQLMERIQRLQRGTSIVSDETTPSISNRIRERIHDRMEQGQFIPEIRASFPPSIESFAGIEIILSEEEEILSAQARQRRISRIQQIISRISHDIQRGISVENIRESMRPYGLLEVPGIEDMLQSLE